VRAARLDAVRRELGTTRRRLWPRTTEGWFVRPTRILLQVSEATRVARLLAREGRIGAWERQWHEGEEWYFTHVRPPHRFDAMLGEA